MTTVEKPSTSNTPTHEDEVARFYHSGPGGKYAGAAYSKLMGDVWFHGDPDLETAGMTPRQAAIGTLKRLAAEVEIEPEDRVLDFGSGPGGGLIELASMTEAVCVGLSIPDDLNGMARKLAAARGMEGQVSFLTPGPQDYRTLSAFPDGSFTVATAFESICHVTRPDLLFDALYRVVKPGGWLIVRDWAARPWGEYQSTKDMNRFLGPVCEHISLAELRTLGRHVALIEAAGFTVHRAVDVFDGMECWGATPPEDRPKWLDYTGPVHQVFREGKEALDAARGAGVFTVIEVLARRPAWPLDVNH